VFELYTKEQLTPFRIAERLNALGIPAPRSEKWKKDTIRWMVKNRHYIGKVVFNKIKDTPVLENGEVVVRRFLQPEDEVIVAEGKQPPIVDMDTWEAAQKLVARNPRVKHTHPLKNPFSGMLVCGKCGRAMYIHPYKHAEDRFECRSTPRCFKSVKQSELIAAILFSLEHSELPELQLKIKSGDGNAAKTQQALLKKLEAQMQDYREQEENQFDLLETGKYSQDLFDRRNAALREKMEECQAQIYKVKSVLPTNVDYAERIATLQTAINMMRDPEASPTEKNRILKSIIEKIEFFGSPPVDKSVKGWKKGENNYSLKVHLRL